MSTAVFDHRQWGGITAKTNSCKGRNDREKRGKLARESNRNFFPGNCGSSDDMIATIMACGRGVHRTSIAFCHHTDFGQNFDNIFTISAQVGDFTNLFHGTGEVMVYRPRVRNRDGLDVSADGTGQ